MPKKLSHWRHGSPPYTFVWQENPPESEAVIVDEKSVLVAGEAIANRAMLYYSGSDVVSLAIANGTAKTAACISLEAASLNGYLSVSGSGTIVSGFSGLTPGATYYLSQSTAGAITATKPLSGEVFVVGAAVNATDLNFSPLAMATALPSYLKYFFPIIPEVDPYNPPNDSQETSGTWVVKARRLLDFTAMKRDGTTFTGTMITHGKCDSGVTGEVRLYNETDAQQLGLISYTETSYTNKSAALSNVPTSGVKLITIEMRRTVGSGASKVYVRAATVNFNEGA